MKDDVKHKQKTVLIVDDSHYSLQVLESILKEKGFGVITSKNGYEALNLARRQQPDVILLDVIMPKIDGFETCKRLRKTKLTKNIPVIFITAKEDNESVVHGFEIGGQDYVKKPYFGHELIARVNTQIELKQKNEELEEMNIKLEEKVLKRTKELQNANAKLEKLTGKMIDFNRLKAGFLNIISHEIRTPLHGILGFSSILKTKLQSTEYEVYVNKLKKSAERLHKFSKNALLITELHTKLINVEPEALVVNDLFTKILEKRKNRLTKKNLQTKVEMDNPHMCIKADNYLINRALLAVFDNAVKYSNIEGTIILRGYEKDNTTIIEVEDFGEGFTQTARNHLFEYFVTGHETVNLEKGLGLPLAKLVMDAHSGSIEFDFDRKEGTKAILFLPK